MEKPKICGDGQTQDFSWMTLEANSLGLITGQEGWKKNGILIPKLFWPTVRKNCSSDWEKILKFKAEGQEFAKILRSLEQFLWTVKGQKNFW